MMSIDPGQIVERHSQQLKEDISTFISYHTDGFIQRIRDLEKQLSEKEIVIEHYKNASSRAQMEVSDAKAELQRVKTAERRVVCIIDGDGYIFSQAYLQRGVVGGREAAQKLNEYIKEQVQTEHEKLHVWIFVNLRGLNVALRKCNNEEAADGLDGFMWGFNQAAERFAMIDVGGGKEAVDAKVKAYLEDEVKSLETAKVIAGVCHDHGYLHTIRSVLTAGYGQKLVLLSGYAEMAVGFRQLELPVLTIPDLFEHEKLATPTPAPLGPPPGLSLSPTRVGMESPKVSPRVVATYKDAIARAATSPNRNGRSPSIDQPRARHIDPTKTINQQNPPPCTLFYLTENCKAGANCRYGHDYILQPEHYEEMRTNAKKSPCNATNRGDICPFGDACCYGHKCPYLNRCHYYKAGTCKFVGAGMHAE